MGFHGPGPFSQKAFGRMNSASIQANPIAIALALLFTGLGSFAALDFSLRPRLEVPLVAVNDAPILDGDTSDAAWSKAPPVIVVTRHGGDFGGNGETEIEVRAVHDQKNIYFAISWEDPTRSLARLPLMKRYGVWHVLQGKSDGADEDRLFDDRLAIMIAKSGRELIGGAIHLGKRPLAHAPEPISGRGLHYIESGKPLDIWEWNAAAGAITQRLRDDSLGRPQKPTKDQLDGKLRYLGGISTDLGQMVIEDNFITTPRNHQSSLTLPKRLPSSLPKEPLAEDLNLIPSHSAAKDEEAIWVLPIDGSIPYSPAADAQIPDGTVIPGVLSHATWKPGDKAPRGRGMWSAGRWVIEIARSLEADPQDVPIASGTLVWLAAFDHSQTRHSYHLRPLKLELE